jgi:phage-related protein
MIVADRHYNDYSIRFSKKPMTIKPIRWVGAAREEIQSLPEDAYRVFYIARFEEAIYVLHAFQKKTQKTAKKNIEVGQKRYQQLLQNRLNSREPEP